MYFFFPKKINKKLCFTTPGRRRVDCLSEPSNTDYKIILLKQVDY